MLTFSSLISWCRPWDQVECSRKSKTRLDVQIQVRIDVSCRRLKGFSGTRQLTDRSWNEMFRRRPDALVPKQTSSDAVENTNVVSLRRVESSRMCFHRVGLEQKLHGAGSLSLRLWSLSAARRFESTRPTSAARERAASVPYPSPSSVKHRGVRPPREQTQNDRLHRAVVYQNKKQDWFSLFRTTGSQPAEWPTGSSLLKLDPVAITLFWGS